MVASGNVSVHFFAHNDRYEDGHTRESTDSAKLQLDTISLLNWCHICHECYCAGENIIDLGVILMRGKTVSLTPRMRDTNYRQFTPKYTDN